MIRNSNLVDGSGGPARIVDVTIDGDRIVAVGDAVGGGSREIDADGYPGLVDVHTHYDAQARPGIGT